MRSIPYVPGRGFRRNVCQALTLSVNTFIHDICVVFGFWGGFLHVFPLGTRWCLLKRKIIIFDHSHFEVRLWREDVSGVILPFECTFFSRKPVAGPHQSSFDTFCPQVPTLSKCCCIIRQILLVTEMKTEPLSR